MIELGQTDVNAWIVWAGNNASAVPTLLADSKGLLTSATPGDACRSMSKLLTDVAPIADTCPVFAPPPPAPEVPPTTDPNAQPAPLPAQLKGTCHDVDHVKASEEKLKANGVIIGELIQALPTILQFISTFLKPAAA